MLNTVGNLHCKFLRLLKTVVILTSQPILKGLRALRVPTNHYKAEEEVSMRLGFCFL